MRNRIYVLMAGLALSSTAAQAENGGRGGGDLCQSRIEATRNDIESWIAASASSSATEKLGSAQLDFSRTRTHLAEYNRKMQEQIVLTREDAQTSISCTNNQSEVQVAGKDKVCIAYFEAGRPRILCYRGKTQGDGKYVDGFMGASQDEQHFQTHHELAVLAGFEDQAGDETNYPLSNQVLAIKSAPKPAIKSTPRCIDLKISAYKVFSHEWGKLTRPETKFFSRVSGGDFYVYGSLFKVPRAAYDEPVEGRSFTFDSNGKSFCVQPGNYALYFAVVGTGISGLELQSSEPVSEVNVPSETRFNWSELGQATSASRKQLYIMSGQDRHREGRVLRFAL